MIFKRKPAGSIIFLRDATNEDWERCKGLGHVPTTYQYGAHPMRVFQFCPFCHVKARLEWKDTYGRLMNRIVGSLPAVFTLTSIVVVIAITLIAILPYVHA